MHLCQGCHPYILIYAKFHVPISVEDNSQILCSNTLIDSIATSCFIDVSYREQVPILVEVFDGRPIDFGKIPREMNQLVTRVNSHQAEITRNCFDSLTTLLSTNYLGLKFIT